MEIGRTGKHLLLNLAGGKGLGGGGGGGISLWGHGSRIRVFGADSGWGNLPIVS